MAARSTAVAWSAGLRFLHWGMLLIYVGIITVGFYMTGLPLGPAKLKIYALHKSIGLSLLALAAVRLAWRAAQRRPPPAAMPAWQAAIATTTKGLLYALMFVMPLSGWLYNSAAGFPLQWFRLVNLPALTAADPALNALAKSVHETGVIVLIVLVAAHAAAALKHHFIDRDSTLVAMLPWVGGRAP
jgi:cytochrome b561